MKPRPATARRVASCSCLAAIFGMLALPCGAADGGETASSELQAAERAYQEIDFVAARRHAVRALAVGGGTREETARLHVIGGISAAAMGNDADAKHDFIVALGIRPELKLDRSLSPKIRGPYLEAQGFWGAYAVRLGLEGHVAGDRAHLAARLVDPGDLVAKIELRVRPAGGVAYESLVAAAKPVLGFALSKEAQARGFEYFLVAIDEHSNTLAEVGSADDPRAERSLVSRTPAVPMERSTTGSAGGSLLWPAVLEVTGAGALAAGVVFHLRREDDARQWNGSSCEHPGLSRIEQCGDVDTRLRRDERFAIGGYALGGALVAGGAIWFAVARGASSEPEQDGKRSGHTSLTGCGIGGPGVSCVGRF